MEQMANRDIRGLAVPCDRGQHELEEMERLLEESNSEVEMKVATTCTDEDVLELTRKLHDWDLK